MGVSKMFEQILRVQLRTKPMVSFWRRGPLCGLWD